MVSSESPEAAVSKPTSDRAARWDDSTHGLRWRGARTVYNVVDALAPGLTTDLAPGLSRQLRHAGPGAARQLWLWLVFLDWEPLFTLRARSCFWRLPRAERARAVRRWQRSRLGPRRRAFARLAGWLASENVRAQSIDGA